MSDVEWDCNEMLLKAVDEDNVEEVERLLQHPDLNVNYETGYGSTALFESLYGTNESIFMSLLDAGFDSNFRNNRQETPLHIAVVYSPIGFMQELIKRAADINARDLLHETPLHNVAMAIRGNLDRVCILLYYGADVNVVSCENMTPLMYALQNNQIEVSKILFSFYDDFSCTGTGGRTSLGLAAMKGNPLALDIFRSGTNQTECGDDLLRWSLQYYKSAELFKLIWSRYREEICLDMILLGYLSFCCFSNSDWLECLHLLFTASIKIRHLPECKTCRDVRRMQADNIMPELLLCLYERKIDLPNRMGLIYLCLSLGVKITIEDINLAYLLYGFHEELEAFLYTFNYEQSIVPNNLLPLPRFIFVLEDDYKVEMVPPVFQYYLNNTRTMVITKDILQDAVVKSIGYCSLSFVQKQGIKELWKKRFHDEQDIDNIDKRLAAIPEVPSLIELSRNQIRKSIKQSCRINKPYQFHTIVRELNLSQYLKDIIRFKIPVYY